MATNKKFRIQNGANIEGELTFNNQTVINNDGTVVASSVQPAVESLVNTTYVNALNVTAFSALSADTVSDISSFSTTDVTEGANLYFTDQRARSALVGGTGISYDTSTGEMSTNLVGGDGIAVSGNQVSLDGSAISQDLVPAEDDVYSLGSPDKVWRDVYIGPGSLYINGTKILEDNSGTITMYADPGQNLAFGVTEGGSIDFNAGASTIDFKSDVVLLPGKTITTSGGNATEFGGDVEMNGNCIFNVAVPQTDGEAANKGYVDSKISVPHVGDKSFLGDVDIQGNLSVQGTVTTVNSETISLADNIIDLNSNVTSGTPTENAGFRVMRGDEAAAQIRWNEAMDHWEVFNGSQFVKIALSTSDLEEGSNKYFTDERVNAIVGPIEGVLQDADSDEMVARIAGDAVLQSAIDAESVTRANADSDLNDKIDVEIQDRIDGDSDTLQSAKDYADGHKSTADTKFGIIDLKDSDQDVAIAQNAADIVSGDSDTLQSAKDYADGHKSTLDTKNGEQDGLISANATAIAGLDSDLGAESAARFERDGQLQSSIDTLTGNLDLESIARGDGDSALQTAIDAVDAKVDAILGTSPETLDTLQEIVAAFDGADSDLQSVISNNGVRLTNAEGNIDTLESQFNAISSSLNTLEIRVGDDEVDLSNEITRSTNKDAEHDARLDALEAYDHVSPIENGDSDTLAAAKAYTDQEVSALDADLSEQIGTLNTTVTNLPIESGDADTLQSAKDYADQKDNVLRQEFGAGDSDLNDALAQEIAARIAGDASLQSQVNVEEIARANADSDLNVKIDVESVARANADADLQSQLNTLNQTVSELPIDDKDSDVLAAAKAYADAGDSTLQTQIDNILSNTDSAALNSLAEIVAEFQKVDGTLVGSINANAAEIDVLQADVSALQGQNLDSRVTVAEGILVNHEGRIVTLESKMTQVEQEIIDLPVLIKNQITGGLCIIAAEDSAGNLEISIDEAEVATELKTSDTFKLEGQSGDYYRINVYRVDGQLVN